jgi:hypothetical protein
LAATHCIRKLLIAAYSHISAWAFIHERAAESQIVTTTTP